MVFLIVFLCAGCTPGHPEEVLGEAGGTPEMKPAEGTAEMQPGEESADIERPLDTPPVSVALMMKDDTVSAITFYILLQIS